jgi:MinD superfamily P-loop ATPase
MHELVVISGKGGTGKTSVVASFASLAGDCVLADADVDAADLHLVLSPENIHREDFSGGSQARIITEACSGCGQCEELCRFGAVFQDGTADGETSATRRIDPLLCEGCGVCAHFCEEKAIEFLPAKNGELFVSETRHGPMVHARLGIAEENSGKLVTAVRTEARQLAEERQKSVIVVDGPPGIGCPVIASLTGASMVLVVTEPTLSGEHDLDRVLQLTKHFGILTTVCTNKWDINEARTGQIEARARAGGAMVVGRIRYDGKVTSAQLSKQAAVEYGCDAGDDIKRIWEVLGSMRSQYGL